jgi:hypothetical protein
MPDVKHFHVCRALALWTLNIIALHGWTQGSTGMAGDRAVAVRYCGGCHLFPEAGLLDRHTWTTSVLPRMGWRLGVRNAGLDPYADLDPDEAERVRKTGVYPEARAVSADEWRRIERYFTTTAPDSLKAPEDPVGASPLPAGLEAIPLTIGEKAAPRTTLLRYDTAAKLLYIGDAEGELSILDGTLSMRGYWQLTLPPADVVFPRGDLPRLLCVGSIAPTQERNGALFALDSTGGQGPAMSKPLTGLARPVHASMADLDGNGTPDALVCEFGHHTGSLSLFPDGDPKRRTILSPTPGARRTEVRDIDGDGKPDILALMAQGDERLSLFRNLGKGRFQEKVLLRFPPLQGLSHFELADFDGDGRLDVLMTNGDNWDYSAVRKPYHGIRIFLNQGGLQYREAWFQPFYGASKAMATDMDGDGDLDIAAISFYDAPDDPARGFLFLENLGGLRFRPWSVPAAASGKWLTMETCDLDGDGRMDIVLGSYFHNAAEVARLSAKGVTEFPQALVLMNRLGRRPD